MTPEQALEVLAAFLRSDDFEKCWRAHNQINTAIQVLDTAISEPSAQDDKPQLRLAKE